MIKRTLARLAHDCRGAAAVEFAIILLPLSIVLIGGLDLGYQSYLRATLQGTLNDVARLASVESPDLGTSGATLEAKVENAIKQRMSVLAKDGSYTIRMRNYSSFSGAGKPEPLVTDKNNNGRYDAGDCWQDINPNGSFDLDSARSGIGGASDVVFYDVTESVPRILPMAKLVGLPANHVVKASVAIRSQPYDDQERPTVAC
ncbi:pilus assembly protein [Sphingomonas piscis]|uniref:Pilus assembly protein n=1 Tax=Sphingomonas piscis TaxID=2714943 RepID=A0A6G7YMA4_9SPHN|nr:TadE/TadG family type IV pilus assembly protein [Sphingomonas piscis]QIK77874.1 pilus assembly protein [Sphingomonas piscis]